MNTNFTELEKATDIKKVELEKEIIEFGDLHDSLDKDACTLRQSNGIRSGNIRTVARDISNIMESGQTKVTHERIPYLSSFSI